MTIIYHKRKLTFRFAMLLLSLPGSLAFATPPTTAQQQLNAEAQKQAISLLQQEAQTRGWPQYSVKLDITLPADAGQLPLCPGALKTAGAERGHSNLNHLRLDFRCTGSAGWFANVTVKPDILMPVVMSTAPLERGHVIVADDVTLKKYSLANVRNNIFWRTSDVVGMTLKRQLAEMTPISQNMLESPVMVERGQRVVMMASQDGVTAQTGGIAMKKGHLGEIIKVKNESSGQQISARVTDFGTVSTVMAAVQ